MKRIILLFLLSFVIVIPSYANKKAYIKPVVVTFLKQDCDECDALDMVRQAVEEEYGNKLDFININTDEEDTDYEKLMQRYNIKGAPVTLFINSQYGITKKIADYVPYNIYIKNIQSINR